MCAQIYQPDDLIDKINDGYWDLRAEAVPEEELDTALDPETDCLIHVYHFHQTFNHSVRIYFIFLFSKCQVLCPSCKPKASSLSNVSTRPSANALRLAVSRLVVGIGSSTAHLCLVKGLKICKP